MKQPDDQADNRPARATKSLRRCRRLQLAVKRAIDVLGATTGLILCGPVMLVVASLIKLTGRGPVLFRQVRVGKGGRAFKLNKFRTMVLNAERMGTGLTTAEGDPRITPLGRLLRKSSIDELPQLFNVLLGDISLVGPRPTVPEHLEYYGPFEWRRLEMRPGITGLATVRGRSSIPWSIRIRHDVEYIDSFGLWQDLKILLRTVVVVLRREGTYYCYEKYGPAFDLPKRRTEKSDAPNADGA